MADAQMFSETGSFGWCPSSGELFWSAETFWIFGYHRTFKPTVQSALERVYPEDLRIVQEAFDSASHGKDLDLEHRLVTPDGSIKRVHVPGHALSRGAVNGHHYDEKCDGRNSGLAGPVVQREPGREEIDITRMFEGIVGSSPALQAALLEEEAGVQAAAVQAAERSLALSNTRYEGGVTSYLEVITAQNSALTDEVTAVNILGRRMASAVLLIEALGGGWDRSNLTE
ncbi:MAG TPA: PAS domain-containing protein, partial [Candidatus Acidoferrum sp.]